MGKIALACILFLIVSSCRSSAQDIEVVEAFPNLAFSQPTDIQNAGDGSNRLFVCEKRGVIRAFNNDPGVTTTTTFLDISNKVITQSEMGLLGLAFHPNFANNGLFYVHYNTRRGDSNYTVISKFSAVGEELEQVDLSSECVIMAFSQPFPNHDGGQIAFGPNDGYLYISMGDGGAGGDPLNSGQRTNTSLGKILRIDVDNPSGGRNYGIPIDNPFVNVDDTSFVEIYAYGLRNAWRMSFDPETGKLWAADVGQDGYEEIDIIVNGGNYGWNIMEGWHCYNGLPCDSTGLISPIWEYNHSQGNSITGGYVYRGSKIEALQGMYIYGDFGSGRVWGLVEDENTGAVDVTLLKERNVGFNVATFGVDEDREIYIGVFNGKIYKFETVTDVNEEDGEQSSGLGMAIDNVGSDEVIISYHLDKRADVSVGVFDATGREVVTLVEEQQDGGEHRISFSLDGLPSAQYFVRVITDYAMGSHPLSVAR